jgi:tetratricopeptide (TPR) repeat protein
MNADNLDIRLLRFRSRRDEYPYALASALLDAGRIPEALEVVQVGLLQNEHDAALLVLEGRAWFEQGDLPQAQAALLRAAKVSPRDKEPYRWLSQVLMKRGEPARAVQVLERAMQLDPADRSLQQAHMRAQRLSRIASEADSVGEPEAVPPPRTERQSAAPRVSAPAIPPVAGPAAKASPAQVPAPPMRITERPRSSAPAQARVALPKPPKVVPPPPAPAARPSVPLAAAQPASARANKAELRATPFDAAPDSGPPIELARPLSPRADGDEDEPTVAAELPKELRSWLDAERSSHTPIPASSRSNNDNHAYRERAHADEYHGGTDFSGESEPTLAVHSGEISDVLAEIDRGRPAVIVADSIDQPLAELAGDGDAERAPPAEPEAPEEVLRMLAQQGIFEAGHVPKEASTWVPKAEAPRAGTRIGTSLVVGWLLAACAAGGGYYGFMHWLELRRGDARSLITQAEEEARDGQYESLLAAERHLTQARTLDPKASRAVELLLFVHATRALEDASGEMGYLRNTIVRAREKQVSASLLSATEALLAAYEGDAPAARAKAETALKAAGDDARIHYLVGRLYQRAGLPEAAALLERATQRDPALGLAWLARGEIAYLQGDVSAARELFGKARGADNKALRAELWQIVVDTDAEHATQLKGQLDALAQRIEHGSAADKLLAVSARAGLLLAAGDVAGARAVVLQASKLHGVRAPELTALFAERALAVGELDLAYRAASSTLKAAPGVRRYRDTLVSVLLRRGDGSAALSALSGSESDGGSLLVVRARAALLDGSRAALDEAKRTLSSFRASAAGKDDADAAALLIRVDLRLGANGEALLPTARALAQRSASNAAAQLALAEAALSARQAQVALTALDKAKALTRDDADVYYLAGRAQRMLGKFDAARGDLEKALEIAPSHADARYTLAELCLDSGDYAAAYALYNALERDGAGISAMLGAAEAQVAKGEVTGAELRFGKLSEEDKQKPAAQVLSARIALAKNSGAEAAKVLEPLVREDSETRTADVLALYGDALFAADRVDSAAGAYDAAIEIDEAHPDALVGRAMAALRAEKTKQVGELIARAEAALGARLRPPSLRAKLLLTQAKVEILAQGYSAAKEKLARAVSLDGAPAEAYFWYAETLAKTKTAGATDNYAKYLELAPNGYYAGRAKKALAPR